MTGRDAWLVSVGDELLNGRTLDTNAHVMQGRLARHGVEVRGVRATPDRAEAIRDALDGTTAGSLVILTGGLGPTPDDLTKAAVAGWAGVSMENDPGVEDALRRRCEEKGYPWGPNIAGQALAPVGARCVINPAGTAPAIAAELNDRLVVMLPGVPDEIAALWPGVEALLAEVGALGEPRPVLMRRTCGLSEPGLAGRTAPLVERWGDLDWSWWLTRWGVDVQARATAARPELPAELPAALDTALGDAVYAETLRELNVDVVETLVERGVTVAVAESCTGGLLGAALTDVPGCSEAFLGGVLSYADAVKIGQLGVDEDILGRDGAVSEAVASAMALGARERLGADYALAVTGIAGPDGGTAEKPVGTTWIAVADADGARAGRFRFRSHRERNRHLAAATALDGLRRLLAGLDPWGGERG